MTPASAVQGFDNFQVADLNQIELNGSERYFADIRENSPFRLLQLDNYQDAGVNAAEELDPYTTWEYFNYQTCGNSML